MHDKTRPYDISQETISQDKTTQHNPIKNNTRQSNIKRQAKTHVQNNRYDNTIYDKARDCNMNQYKIITYETINLRLDKAR